MSPEPTPVDVPTTEDQAAAPAGSVQVDPAVIEQAAQAEAAAAAAQAVSTEPAAAAEADAAAAPVAGAAITPEQAEAALTDECKRDLAVGRYVRLGTTLRAKAKEFEAKAADAGAQVTALLGG